MGDLCSTHGGEQRCVQGFGWENGVKGYLTGNRACNHQKSKLLMMFRERIDIQCKIRDT
jgi:hypothetical protein